MAGRRKGKRILITAAGLGRAELRANALRPGAVDGPSLRGRIAAAPDPARAERGFVARQPMGPLALVDDLSPMVACHLSSESHLMTGQAVPARGGITV